MEKPKPVTGFIVETAVWQYRCEKCGRVFDAENHVGLHNHLRFHSVKDFELEIGGVYERPYRSKVIILLSEAGPSRKGEKTFNCLVQERDTPWLAFERQKISAPDLRKLEKIGSADFMETSQLREGFNPEALKGSKYLPYMLDREASLEQPSIRVQLHNKKLITLIYLKWLQSPAGEKRVIERYVNRDFFVTELLALRDLIENSSQHEVIDVWKNKFTLDTLTEDYGYSTDLGQVYIGMADKEGDIHAVYHSLFENYH